MTGTAVKSYLHWAKPPTKPQHGPWAISYFICWTTARELEWGQNNLRGSDRSASRNIIYIVLSEMENTWPQMSACEFQLELVIHSSQHHTQVSCIIMHLMHYYSTLEQIIRMILYLQHEKLFSENCRTQPWSAHTVPMEQTPEDAFYQI